MNKLTFACMATGQLYGMADLYIDRLHQMLLRNVVEPFELLCFTDRPRSVHQDIVQIDCSGWHELLRDGMRPTTRKLGIFNPAYVQREWVIYLDLTLVIRQRMDALIAHMRAHDDDLVIVRDWNYDSFNSSVMSFKPRHVAFIYEAFKAGTSYPQTVQGDQEFIHQHVRASGYARVSLLPAGQVCSFKQAVRTARKNPALARQMVEESIIVKFHGQPRMHQAFDPWYRFSRITLKALAHGRLGLPFSIGAMKKAWEGSGRMLGLIHAGLYGLLLGQEIPVGLDLLPLI